MSRNSLFAENESFLETGKPSHFSGGCFKVWFWFLKAEMGLLSRASLSSFEAEFVGDFIALMAFMGLKPPP